MADLAADAEDIKSRLANVPVYTVANKKNEFVLVSGEVCPSAVKTVDDKLFAPEAFAGISVNVLMIKLPARERVKRSSWAFSSSQSLMPGRWWRRCGALHLLSGHRVVTPGLLTLRDAPQIREQNPKLAKQTQVLKVTVDKASAAHRPFCYVVLCTPD